MSLDERQGAGTFCWKFFPFIKYVCEIIVAGKESDNTMRNDLAQPGDCTA